MPILEAIRPIQHIERLDLCGSIAGVAIKVCGSQDRDGRVIDAVVGHYLTDGVISPTNSETAMSFAVWQEPEPVDVSERVLLLGAYRRGAILGGVTADKIHAEGVDTQKTLFRISDTAQRGIDRVDQARKTGQKLPPSSEIMKILKSSWHKLLIGSLIGKVDLFEDVEELVVAAKTYEAFARAEPNQTVLNLQAHLRDRVGAVRAENPLPL